MLERNRVTRDVIIHQTVVEHEKCSCDVCGKDIFKKTILDQQKLKYKNELFVDKSYRVVIGYEDGTDLDSYENYACSDECLASLFLDYLEKYSKEHEGSYFEVREYKSGNHVKEWLSDN